MSSIKEKLARADDLDMKVHRIRTYSDMFQLQLIRENVSSSVFEGFLELQKIIDNDNIVKQESFRIIEAVFLVVFIFPWAYGLFVLFH